MPAPRSLLALAAGAACALSAPPAAAQQLDLGSFEIGGALRANFWDKSWTGTERRPIDEVELDTLRIRLSLETEKLFGAIQWRYYYYPDTDFDAHFPHHAYLGWRFDEDRTLSGGIVQVPFGLLPYAGNSFFLSIAYYLGLEDDYDLGLRYDETDGPWSFQLAYYLSDEGDFFGESEDSARYSYDPVDETGRGNGERHQGNARFTYAVEGRAGWTAEIGASLQAGLVPNAATDRSGSHFAWAGHLRAAYGRWELKYETVAYDYDLELPPGEDPRLLTVGAYDYPYSIAADGLVHSVALSYALPVGRFFIESVTFYNDYSVLLKSEDAFADTQHNVLGAALDFEGPLFVYVDLALGRNNAWIGPDFTTALGTGGTSDDWHHRFNVNVGLYF